jgi:hypothetical protein
MRRKPISHKILFGVIFAGLNLLCFMGALHGHRVVHHTRIDYSHIPAQGTRRSRIAITASPDSVVEHAVVIHLSASQVSGLAHSGSSVPPQMAIAPAGTAFPVPDSPVVLLARENVLALGSAPRAPGLGRAPPSA